MIITIDRKTLVMDSYRSLKSFCKETGSSYYYLRKKKLSADPTRYKSKHLYKIKR
jgi:hypothetical protein